MQDRNRAEAASQPVQFQPSARGSSKAWPHPVDKHVGTQLATVRVHSDITQAQLAKVVGISFQQLQKYENAKNRVSASMLYEIAGALGIPVGRLFEGLPGNDGGRSAVNVLPVDERIAFIASAEGRRLIEGLMQLNPRVRARVSSLIAALGDELPRQHPTESE